MSVAIKVEHVRKSLQGREILKGIDFSVESGDIFGFLGPNGAGKTTTIRILLGLYKADAGNVSILGYDVNNDESRRDLGFVLDGDGLYDNMSAAANMEYYLKIYDKPIDKTRIHKLLEIVGLADRAKDKAGTFSKGMRQKLALARALVHDPKVLILDEPTSGIDPSAQIEVRQIMLDIAHKENKTIFLSSHNLDEVQRICNRIALIDKGEVKLYGELEALRKQMGKDTVEVQTGQPVADSLLAKLKSMAELGLKEKNEKSLTFVPARHIKTSDIVNILTKEGVSIEGVTKKEASLEEMYSTIVRKAGSV